MTRNVLIGKMGCFSCSVREKCSLIFAVVLKRDQDWAKERKDFVFSKGILWGKNEIT